MMDMPTCECFKRTGAEAAYREKVIIAVAQGGVAGLDLTRQMNGICNDACHYLSVTAIVLLLRGIAMMRGGEDEAKCDSEFGKMVAALADDVRERDQVLRAFYERAEQGGLQS